MRFDEHTLSYLVLGNPYQIWPVILEIQFCIRSQIQKSGEKPRKNKAAATENQVPSSGVRSTERDVSDVFFQNPSQSEELLMVQEILQLSFFGKNHWRFIFQIENNWKK